MFFDLSIIVNSGSSMSILNRRLLSLIRNLSFQYSIFKVQSCQLSLTSGDGEIRTLDPLLARQVLSQLSYTPTDIYKKK